MLIPIQCEYYALEGLNQLINNINLVRAHLNPTLDVSTILLTMYDRRTRLADAVEQDVRNHFGDKVLQAVIPRNVRVSEAPSYGQSVMTYDPGSRGATSYFEAAQEIAERGPSRTARMRRPDEASADGADREHLEAWHEEPSAGRSWSRARGADPDRPRPRWVGNGRVRRPTEARSDRPA